MIGLINMKADPSEKRNHPEISKQLENLSMAGSERSMLAVVRDKLNPRESLGGEKTSPVVGLAAAYIGSLAIPRTAYISEISIQTREQFQDQNIGSLLLEECIDWAEDHDAMVLESAQISENDAETVHSLYEEYGFELTSDQRRFLVL